MSLLRTVFQLDDIYRAKRKIEETTYGRDIIHGVRLAPDVLEAMKRNLPSWAGESKEEQSARAALWGIPCIVDETLPAGKWEAAYDRETWLRWLERA